ncbi:MAG: carbohydrate kinase family protein, partial [Nanoarchaeota archaeon]|nr:carbohydrate kinase family protein [Nanoarchaeota archaeon]
MNLDTRLLVIGQSVMDYLCTENKTINEQYGIEAFSMNKKEIKILNKLLEVAEITSQSVGGCATNTSFGLNNLGFKHTYLGTVGDDEDGSYFIKEFNKLKFVNSQITQQVDGKTGKILTFFGKTDNSNQRTNAYNYGVANDLQIPKNFFNFAYFSLFSLLEDPSNKVFNLLQDLHKKGTKIMVDGG